MIFNYLEVLLFTSKQGQVPMCFVLPMLGLLGAVAGWFLAPYLTLAGSIVVGVGLIVLYVLARKHGNNLTPGMELIAPEAVVIASLGFFASLLYHSSHSWLPQLTRFFIR